MDEFAGYAGDDYFKESAGDAVDEEVEVAADAPQTLNPKSVRERIDETLEVLSHFKTRNDINISRVDLLSTLKRLVESWT